MGVDDPRCFGSHSDCRVPRRAMCIVEQTELIRLNVVRTLLTALDPGAVMGVGGFLNSLQHTRSFHNSRPTVRTHT